MSMKDAEKDPDIFEIANKILDRAGIKENKNDPPTSTAKTNTAPVTESILPSIDSMTEGSGSVSEPQIFIPTADKEVFEEGFQPAFVNVDHELETPKGIEGPATVIVEAPTSPATVLMSFPESNNSLPETPITEVKTFLN